MGIATMSTPESRQFAGRNCWITWTDELGLVHNRVVKVETLQYVPQYGVYVLNNDADALLSRKAQIPLFE